MYGLPQAGLLTQKLLAEYLEKHGYKQSEITQGFGHTIGSSVKYVGQEHADHLTAALKETYDFEEDPEGSKYV